MGGIVNMIADEIRNLLRQAHSVILATVEFSMRRWRIFYDLCQIHAC